ncbi:hypothetical protein NXX09_22165 [Bacteroides uniformis]|nr:hypothetical protein [Bacteroides uniformis]
MMSHDLEYYSAVMSFDDLYILWQLRSFGGGSYITDKSEGLNFHVW